MSKDCRLKQEYRKSASKLHRAVGNMLSSSILFANYRIYQEYPVNRVSPYFDSGREKFDWVILDLMIVIECHGQQHYKPVRFGGISQAEAETKFQDQLLRDLKKKLAAEKAGWTYVTFKFDEKDISSTVLLQKIEAAGHVGADRNQVSQQVKNKRGKVVYKDYHKEQLRKAREYRKEQYKKQKASQDARKRETK